MFDLGDRETVQHILALADELMQRARGRDEEFWFQAEREIRDAER